MSPGFAIEGPSQAKIECEDQNDGSCDVRYWPTEPGEYAIRVTCDEEDIELSPFMAHIVPDTNVNHPEKVRTADGPAARLPLDADQRLGAEMSGLWVLGPGSGTRT